MCCLGAGLTKIDDVTQLFLSKWAVLGQFKLQKAADYRRNLDLRDKPVCDVYLSSYKLTS